VFWLENRSEKTFSTSVCVEALIQGDDPLSLAPLVRKPNNSMISPSIEEPARKVERKNKILATSEFCFSLCRRHHYSESQGDVVAAPS